MFNKYGNPRWQHGEHEERQVGGHRGPGRQGWHGQRFGGRSHDEPHGRWRGPFGPGGPGGPGGGGPFDGDGSRRRHRRGDIKFALLALLAEQPRHGYELIKALEERSAGFYRPSPGSVYPTLQLLEDEGHVTSAVVETKRVYTITEAGTALLAARHEHEASGPAHAHGPEQGGAPLAALRQSMVALGASVQQAGRHGSPTQRQAVQALLDATRRQVYAILAEEDGEPQAARHEP